MAAELHLNVVVNKTQLTALKANLTQLTGKTYSIKVDTSGLKALTAAQTRTLAVLTEYNNAQARLVIAENLAKKSANELAISENQLAASENKVTASANRLATSENNLAAAKERTTQSANRLATAQERTAQMHLKATAAAEKNQKVIGNLISTIAKSYLIYGTITKIITAFSNALETMKAVDTELTNIQKVSGMASAELAKIGDAAYETASKYGIAADEYLSAVYTFQKAGLGDSATQMGELAVKTQLVGDTTAAIASQFLISTNAAWDLGGSMERLSQIVDEADYINNNYATSLDKLSAGMPIVASSAANAGMSVEETLAVLGTITAKTQETGTKAATAWRALIMNIAGEVGTFVEEQTGEEIEVTTEGIKSITDALAIYGNQAVKNAIATGEMINPMEAVISLAEAYKDGLLTDIELNAILMDVGGKLRANQLTTLVKDLASETSTYYDILNNLGGAAGTADAEISIMLSSWESKVQVLSNTWTEFVQKSLNTNFIKGFIDGVTDLIKTIGSLSNAIIFITGLVVSLNISRITTGLTKLGRSLWTIILRTKAFSAELLKTKSYSAACTAAGINPLTAALTAATIAITAAVLAFNSYKQSVEEAVQSTVAASESTSTEAENIYNLYAAYNDAQKAYENGTGTKEDLATATNTLTEALKKEGNEAAITAEKIKELSAAESQKAIDDANRAITVLNQQLRNKWASAASYGTTVLGQSVTMVEDPFGYKDGDGLQAYIDGIVESYNKAVEAETEYAKATNNGTTATEEQKEAHEKNLKIINELEDTVSDLSAQQEILSKATEQYNSILDGTATQESGINTVLLEQADEFSMVSEAAEKATAAIESYKEATTTEKDDNFKSYADAWDKFYQDWTSGRKNSNNVTAAIDLFFSPEQQAQMLADGKDLGTELAGAMWQSFFQYDGESTGGEDSGALAAYYLYDNIATAAEDGTKVITDANGKIVASFKETEEGLSIVCDDYELLSQTLSNLGINMDSSFIVSLFQALGVYGGDGLKTSTEDVIKLADSLGLVAHAANGDYVNFESFVKSLKDAGYSTQEIVDLADALVRAKENGQIKLNIDTEGADVGQLVGGILSSTDGEEPTVTTKAEVDDTDAQEKLKILYDKLLIYANSHPEATLHLNTNPALIALSNFMAIARAQTATLTLGKNANGVSNYAGGLSLVNEEGAEIIKEGGQARIAGGGLPTITYLEKGATVYTAGETRQMLNGNNLDALFGGIGAYDGGAVKGIKRWTGGSKSTSSSSSVGSTSSYSGGSSSSKTETDEYLEQLKDIVSLRKSELALLEASGGTIKQQIEKQRQIQAALNDQKNYLISIGGSQEEINKLTTEWYKINQEIADLQNGMLDDLSKAIKEEINKLEDMKEAELAVLDKELEDMKAERDAKDEQLELEEKILAVQEAQANLQKVQSERTVRYFNALTGQWEWGANASNVRSAQTALEDAQKSLDEYLKDKEYNDKVKAIETEKEAIEARYAAEEAGWQEIIDSLAEPVMTIAEAVEQIARNRNSSMDAQINALNEMLAKFGYHIGTYDRGGILQGMGGIKATNGNEMVLPPELTSRMLSPVANSAFRSRMNELKYLYGVESAGNKCGSLGSTIGTQYNGDRYTFGSISLSTEQAKSTSVYEFVKMSRNLRSYSSGF